MDYFKNLSFRVMMMFHFLRRHWMDIEGGSSSPVTSGCQKCECNDSLGVLFQAGAQNNCPCWLRRTSVVWSLAFCGPLHMDILCSKPPTRRFPRLNCTHSHLTPPLGLSPALIPRLQLSQPQGPTDPTDRTLPAPGLQLHQVPCSYYMSMCWPPAVAFPQWCAPEGTFLLTPQL